MDAKTWSYEELTAEVERQIKRSMNEAETDRVESSKTMKRDWASGAFFFWLSLVEGVATDEDRARIKALTKPPAKVD